MWLPYWQQLMPASGWMIQWTSPRCVSAVAADVVVVVVVDVDVIVEFLQLCSACDQSNPILERERRRMWQRLQNTNIDDIVHDNREMTKTFDADYVTFVRDDSYPSLI